MMHSRFFIATTVLAAVTLAPWTSFAQTRGRTGPPSGGQARGSGGPTVRQAVPRPSYPGGGYRPPYYRPSFRPYYGPGFAYGYPYGFYPYGSVGFGFGFGWHGSIALGVGIGYPAYGAYGYPYYAGYPYYYPAYRSYRYPASGYVVAAPGKPSGGVRILDAPKSAQVFVDGYYAGVVDDFDGRSQQVNLEANVHYIEIRAPGFETLSVDVRTQPGQTINYRALMRPAQ